MRLRAALIAGTVLSLAATSAWAWMSALAIGPAASYVALAAAPARNGWELFAVVASIYAACFLVAGWRHARRHRPGREQ
jgi:hypothetical protein